jgi:hypothetical protein
MSCAGGHQDDAPIAGIRDDVVDDVAKKHRGRKPPCSPDPVAFHCERAFSGADQQRYGSAF